jgi:hypothetical protein
VINWKLEVEDVEDVSCTVEDMEAMDLSQSFVQRRWSEGRGDKGTRAEVMEGFGARLCGKYYGIIWSSIFFPHIRLGIGRADISLTSTALISEITK